MPARRTTTLPLPAALVLLGTLALVLLVLAIGLQPYARKKTREALDGLDGAHGDFQDVRVSLFPLRYTITHLKISEKDSLLKQPSFYAERLAITLRWGSLLHGVFRGTVDGDRVKIVLEEPPPGPDQPLPPLSRIIPVRAVLDRAQLRDSEVLYAWVHKQGWPTLWVHDIEATAENFTSRPGLVDQPLTVAARGKIERKGTLWLAVTAQPFAERLTFTASAGADGFDPSQLNAYLAVKQNVTLTPGSYAIRLSFRCEQGRLRGVIEPHLTGTELQSAGDAGSALKAFFGKIALAVSGPTEGTRPSGRIEVSDDLTDPKLQLGPRLEKVVENGFVLGLQETLKRTYSGKTDASGNPAPTPLKARK
jgi:hypothetical protein